MNRATLTRRGAFAAPLALAPLPAMAGLPFHSQADPAIAAGPSAVPMTTSLTGETPRTMPQRWPPMMRPCAACRRRRPRPSRGLASSSAPRWKGSQISRQKPPRDPVDWSRDDFCIPDCFEPAASLRIVWRAIETLDRWATAVGRVEA